MGVYAITTSAAQTCNASDPVASVIDEDVGEAVHSTGYAVIDFPVPDVGTGFATAFSKPAGRGDLADTISILFGGDDYTTRVVGTMSISARSGDPAKRAEFMLASDAANYLDHTGVTSGESVVIRARIKQANRGATILRTIFDGVVDDADFEWLLDGRRVQKIRCVDYSYEFEENFSVEIRVSSGIAGGVDLEYGDLFSLTTTGSPTTVTIGSGAGWTPNPAGPIYRQFASSTTLDLSAFPNLNLTDDEALSGIKSIFINRYGQFDATDGPAPVDGIALWIFQIDYATQPLTSDLFRSQRSFVVDETSRTRSGLARAFLRIFGYANWAQLRVPIENDEPVSGDVLWDDRPFNELMKQWGEPSLWKWRIGNDRIPEYVYSRTPAHGIPRYTYTLNHEKTLSIRPPSASKAITQQTVTGVLIINLGLRGRWEGSISKIVGELAEKEPPGSSGVMGGEIRPWLGGITTRGVIAKVTERRYLVGDTVLIEESRKHTRRNPYDYQCLSNTVIGMTDGLSADGAELGFNYKHPWPKLLEDERTTTVHRYPGRVKSGSSTRELRTINPEALYGGALHEDRDEYATSLGGFPKVLHGWSGDEEGLHLVRTIEDALYTNTAGKIYAHLVQTFDMQNMHLNHHEQPRGYPDNSDTFASRPLHYAGYVLPSPSLMKTNEVYETFKQITPRDIRIRTLARNFHKKPGTTAHSTSSVGGSASAGVGHGQGRAEGPATIGNTVKRGKLEYAPTLEDERDVIPVGSTVFSPLVSTSLRARREGEPKRHPFCETAEQCERVARRMFGEANGGEWSVNVGWNPDLKLEDPLILDVTSPKGRRYRPLALVNTLIHEFDADKEHEPTTIATCIVDDIQVRDQLATRTAA